MYGVSTGTSPSSIWKGNVVGKGMNGVERAPGIARPNSLLLAASRSQHPTTATNRNTARHLLPVMGEGTSFNVAELELTWVPQISISRLFHLRHLKGAATGHPWDVKIPVFGRIGPQNTQSSRLVEWTAHVQGIMGVPRSKWVKGDSYP